MPAVLKILLVFAGMLALGRCRVPLGAALVAGGVALNLWAGRAAAAVAADTGAAFRSAELWLMLAVTVLIMEMARFMTDGRNADEIVAATVRWGGRHGRAASMAAMPAMIGLIPMPAGALFSAPFVARTAWHKDSGGAWQSAVNYWFRHVWEYWWPLYPGVIVTMSVFDIPAWKFVAAQLAFTPLALGAGYLFLLRPHLAELGPPPPAPPGRNARAAFLFLPLAIMIVALLGLPPVLRRLAPGWPPQTAKLASMLAGLLCALVVTTADEWRAGRAGEAGRGPSRLFSSLRSRQPLAVLVSLAGVLVFKHLLGTSGLLPHASRELVASGIPVYAAVAALPFLAGLVTGVAIGFAGTSFPLVVGLAAAGGAMTPLATLALAYGCGYMGMMLSPVHLCLLVTRDYFGASLRAIYPLVLPCALAVLAGSMALHLAFRALGL